MTTRGKSLIIGGTISLVIIIGLVMPYAHRLTPTILRVHISGKSWDRATVISPNIPDRSITFSSPDEIIVSPIRHGPYQILVEFEGDQNLWTFYFHLDAGIRRKVDIFMDGTPENDTIAMRTVAYGDKIIYTNTTAANQTSEEHPAYLNEI